MALFKVLKGDASRINNQELHDGYAYYTVNDGGFFIDANPVNSSGESTGNVIRKRINSAENTSFSVEGFTSTNVRDAISEVKKTISYDSTSETLTLA